MRLVESARKELNVFSTRKKICFQYITSQQNYGQYWSSKLVKADRLATNQPPLRNKPAYTGKIYLPWLK